MDIKEIAEQVSKRIYVEDGLLLSKFISEKFAESLFESYKAELLKEVGEPVFVVFDGPPGPDSGRFIEVETKDRFSVMAGDWENHIPDYWRLGPLFTSDQVAAAVLKATKPLEEQLASAQGEIERLKAEANHRYVEQVLSPIRRLLTVARAAWSAADNGLGVLVDDGIELRVSPADFDKLSDALGLLDMLPDDKPGFTLNGPARAEWALRDLIGDTNEAIN